MDIMDIEELIERYFEGDTSAKEEKDLRSFFASGEVPEHLLAYLPLFAYFDEEIRLKEESEARDREGRLKPAVPLQKKKSFHRTVLYAVSGIAASLLFLLAIRQYVSPVDPCFCSDNYVVINGRCYTDIHKVRSLALEALEEVATPADEYFPESEEAGDEHNLIDNQLRELGSILNEEE